MASLGCSWKGSRFSLTVPSKLKGDYGMIEMTFLRVLRPICDVLVPSTKTEDSLSHSTRRKRAWMREDLPAPVRPTTPTFILG